MAFTKLKLTTFGSNIEAKVHQGKSLHFTRVAIGDGLLGTGSMINRTALVSEKYSMKIDSIIATADATQSAVVATLDNSAFTEGFYYRELALFARDPDSGQEGVYLYDNAGQECEFLDTQANGTTIYERIKLIIRVEQTNQITFEASGNPLYLSAEDAASLIAQHNAAANAHPKKADLGDDGKIVSEQLPDMNYESPLSETTSKDTLVDADNIVITDSASENVSKRVSWSAVKNLLKNIFVPLTRTINGKALSADISLTNTDVSAAASVHTHSASNINSGTLASDRLPTVPLTKGGTGQTSAAAALYALINGASALVASGLATGDILALGDISTATGKKVTLANLITFLQSNLGAARIATGSYVGTGTYGADNPCSLTFDFLPQALLISVGSGYSSKGYPLQQVLIRNQTYATTTDELSGGNINIYWGDSIVSWYTPTSRGDNFQLNGKGMKYYYVCLG